ncbi:MAG TPA: hypothetical protein VNH44_09825 [Micropepsaceae bacterium]|nr:hypothetical protein [Micropepsaceae bacterium]
MAPRSAPCAALLLLAAISQLDAPAALAQAFSQPSCNSGWSDGQCWANGITNPPSQTPPVDGEFVAISPLSSVTLDVDAKPSNIDVIGTFIQPTHSLTTDGVVVAPAGGSAATYDLSGGLLNVGGSGTFDLEIGGTFNQSGGAVVLTQALTLETIPFSGVTGTYNLSAGDLSGNGMVVGSGTSPFGVNAGVFNQTGGAVTLTGPVLLGGPFDPAPVAGGIGTLTISDGTFDVSSTVGFGVVVGGTGTGTVTQSGGTVTITSGPTNGGLELGRSTGGTGSYTLSGGELNVDRESVTSDAYMLVGNAGTGAFTQTGGKVSVEGTLTLGFSAGGSGTYDLSGSGTELEADHVVIRNGTFTQAGGTVSIDTNSAGPTGGSLSIFAGGAYSLSAGLTNDSALKVEFTEIIQGGIFTQSGGTNSVDGPLTISNGGQYVLGGIGSQLTVGDDVTVTNASITQTGGSAQVNGGLTIEGAGAGVGSYSLGGLGTLAVAGEEMIGDSGIGSFVQTAGTNSLAGGTLTLGHADTGNGTYELSGTAILAAGGDVVVGDSGTGLFKQTGGAANIAGTLTLGAQAGSHGTLTFSDGTLTVTTDVVVGSGGTGVFTQSGGIVAIDGNLSISATAGSAGTYTLSDGTLQVGGNERVGLVPGVAPSSDNAFIQSGGANQVAGTLFVGAGGGGAYTLSGGTLQALNETIGALGTGVGVFNQSSGVNTVSGTLTIGGGGTSGTYNLSGGIINAGTPKTQGLVNNDTLNITGVSQIAGNLLNNATGKIMVTNATLNVTGAITNLGTITMDPSTVTVHDLTIGASGVIIGGPGDVLAILGDFVNNSVQNTLWNTDAAELDFIGGGTHLFGLAGQNGAGFANNFGWNTLHLGDTDVLDLELASGSALYVKMLQGLDISGNMITNIFGADGLFLYYDAADNPFLSGNYFLEGGGELLALAGPGGGTSEVSEPPTMVIVLAGLFLIAGVGWGARARDARAAKETREAAGRA